MEVGEYYTWRDQLTVKVLEVSETSLKGEVVQAVDWYNRYVGEVTLYDSKEAFLQYFELVSRAKALIYY